MTTDPPIRDTAVSQRLLRAATGVLASAAWRLGGRAELTRLATAMTRLRNRRSDREGGGT